MPNDTKNFFSFKANGIGPHFDRQQINSTPFSNSSVKIAIYAQNGMGKTFFSRMFALSENTNLLSVEDTEHLLSIDKNNGEFNFTIKDSNGTVVHNYNVNITKGHIPTVHKSGEQYLYHVFNSDYIKNNIEATDYSPNGDIQGYILGKSNIDVSKEKGELKNYSIEQENLYKSINASIKDAQQDLRRKGISSTLTQFKEINTENVLSQKNIVVDEPYEILCEQLSKLKNIPEEIPVLPIRMPEINFEYLSSAREILIKPFQRSNFGDEATKRTVQKVRENRKFYETGLMLYKNSHEKKCPFCNQDLGSEAIYIIDLYNQFLLEAESQAIEEIDKNISAISYFKRNVENFYSTYSKLLINFKNYNDYIPKYAQTVTEDLPDNKELFLLIEEVSNLLNDKKSNIDKTEFGIDKIYGKIASFCDNIAKIYTNQYYINLDLQNCLLDSSKTRLEISRKICLTQLNKLISSSTHSCQRINELKNIINALENSIKEKENQAKTSKKELVIELLTHYLNLFFNQKYTLDKKTFGISFMNKSLNEKAVHVLSEGEKSIVAFCYYLATTYTVVSTDDDYENLFFIIDDPISSMDFTHVYSVANIIRSLEDAFPKITNKKIKFIILTHNSEFMSILMDNNIAQLRLQLKKGDITKMKRSLLLPYEYHLTDIKEIAENKKQPCHTTANSIRHIIETIMHFEEPKNNDIKSFIKEDETLSTSGSLYTLINAESHGWFHKQSAVSDDELIDICKLIIDFIGEKYPKQLIE